MLTVPQDLESFESYKNICWMRKILLALRFDDAACRTRCDAMRFAGAGRASDSLVVFKPPNSRKKSRFSKKAK